MRSYALHVSLVCILLVASCRRTAPPGVGNIAQPSAAEVFTHEPSGFRFPPRLGDFAREAVKQYDRDGLNVSVGYNLGQTATMTVFVYPVTPGAPENTLEGHFEACKREVLTRHKGAVLVTEGPTMVSPGGRQQAGKHAVFTFTGPFARRQQAVRSELYVFMAGPWFIKYRTTYPVGDQPTAEPAGKALIEELSWPDRGPD